MTQVTPIRDLKGYLEPERVERLIAVATNPRDALLVRIPWQTGIRVSELIGIRIQDIDFDNRAVVIKVQKMRKKDGKAIERRRLARRLREEGWYPLTRAPWTWLGSTLNGESNFLTRVTFCSPFHARGLARFIGNWEEGRG